MNPDDLELGYEPKQLEFDLDTDNHAYNFNITDINSGSYNGTTDTSGMTVTFNDLNDSYSSSVTYHDELDHKVDDIGQRLSNIEKALGIPAQLKRNREMEEEHPHIKKLAEEYQEEVEKHITLKLLKPNLPE